MATIMRRHRPLVFVLHFVVDGFALADSHTRQAFGAHAAVQTALASSTAVFSSNPSLNLDETLSSLRQQGRHLGAGFLLTPVCLHP